MMYKPFIKLFRTPNRKYFYEPNKNEFITISDESYEYLKKVFDGREDSLEMPNEIKELLDMGYLAEKSVVEKVEHPYTEHIPAILLRKIGKMTLQVTQNCNFRCKYCVYSGAENSYQRVHSNKVMNWNTARKAIDFLWEHSIDSKDVNIGFYGGEPLLEFDLIKKAIEYSRKKFMGKEISFSMTTNGTLLTEEIIRFLSKNKVQLVISLDGAKEINDENRVFKNGSGTYDRVIRKIDLIKQIDSVYANSVEISMVINPNNDFDDINRFFDEINIINKWNIIPSIVDKDYKDEKTFFSEDYVCKYEYNIFLAMLVYFKRVNKKYVSPLTYNSILRNALKNSENEHTAGISKIDAPGGPCIPGQLRLFCDVDGNLFPCERVSEKSAIMNIGDINQGFKYDNVEKLLNIGKLTEGKCKRCWCFKYCSICAKMADLGNELSAVKKIKYCEENENGVYYELSEFLAFREAFEFYRESLKNRNEETYD